jgi:hypothetical protein
MTETKFTPHVHNPFFDDVFTACNDAVDIGEVAYRANHAVDAEDGDDPRPPCPSPGALRAVADAVDAAADALEAANARARAEADAAERGDPESVARGRKHDHDPAAYASELRRRAHSADGARNYARRMASEARATADRLDPDSEPDASAFSDWREIDAEIQSDVLPDFQLF